MRRLTVAALLGLSAAVALAPTRARAAACCLSATATGTGRLLIWERFAIGLRTSYVAGIGSWSTRGEFRTYGADYAEHDWRSELWTLVGVHRRVSLFGRLPWAMNARSAGNLGSAVGGGVGDVQLGTRIEAIAIGEYARVPALAVRVGVTAPSGRSTDAAMKAGDDPLGTSVTGRGAWVLAAGLTSEITRAPWFVQLDADVIVPLPSTRADLNRVQRFGPGIAAAVTAGRELKDGLVLSAYARVLWESDVTIAGRTVDDSARLDTGLGLALSWRFDPHWTLQAGVDSGLFVDALGDNQPGRVTTTLGLRYGYF